MPLERSALRQRRYAQLLRFCLSRDTTNWKKERSPSCRVLRNSGPKRAAIAPNHFDNATFDFVIEFTFERWMPKIIPCSRHTKGTKGSGRVVSYSKGTGDCLDLVCAFKPALAREQGCLGFRNHSFITRGRPGPRTVATEALVAQRACGP